MSETRTTAKRIQMTVRYFDGTAETYNERNDEGGNRLVRSMSAYMIVDDRVESVEVAYVDHTYQTGRAYR